MKCVVATLPEMPDEIKRALEKGVGRWDYNSKCRVKAQLEEYASIDSLPLYWLQIEVRIDGSLTNVVISRKIKTVGKNYPSAEVVKTVVTEMRKTVEQSWKKITKLSTRGGDDGNNA